MDRKSVNNNYEQVKDDLVTLLKNKSMKIMLEDVDCGYGHEVDTKQTTLLYAATMYKAFMELLGIEEDDNSRDTAYRVAKMMSEKTGGIREKPPELTCFPVGKYNQYVAVKDIPYFSICSHHHVPFYGHAHICYWPKDKLVGISKFARVVTHFANKPQIQEGMTTEILEHLHKGLDPKGIVVIVEGEHLCMTSRGAKAVGSSTITQQVKGDIDIKEALSMLKG